MADDDENLDKVDNLDRNSVRSDSGRHHKKKASSRLVLLQGIRRLAMPSRSFSEGTQNVSVIYKNYIVF